MASIDERIVQMSFENQVFETRVAQTMATLSKLDTALKNVGSTSGLQNIEASANKVTLQQPMSALDKLRAKLSRSGEGAAQGFSDIDKAGNKVTLAGPTQAVDKLQGKMGQLSAGSTFTDIERAADRTNLSGLSNALDNVSNKFSILEGAAAVAFGNITTKAVAAGGNFVKGFSFAPIKQGFDEYATNLNSIQTILANTEGQQVSGLGEVNKHLNDLNTYSDQTIYNFSQMAKNIGTFTAAGVDMDKSTQSIKGIANLAALSGSNSQQASTAMYQLSQAIASGKVGLQDWNSVVNAGMGGAVFQKSLMRTAENMGSIEKGAIKIDKATGKATVNGQSFRESIQAKPGQKPWLTDEVLVETLKQFTGDMKEADLVAQGFTKTQAKSIMQQAKTAKAAATEVKTLSQAFDVAKETIGSGWAKTFQNIFGDFKESKKTFTELSQTINGFINTNANARNKVLGDWKALGGRTELIDGIKTAFHNLMAVLGAVKDAFRDVFPAKTGADLFKMTTQFANLMEALTPSKTTLENLQRTLAGVFAVAHIGWTIIKDLGAVFFDLLGFIGKGSGGLLNFTGGIGDFLVGLDKAISKGNALGGFFKSLGNVLRIPIELIKAITSGLGGMFDGGGGTRVDQLNELIKFGKVLSPMERIVNRVTEAWKKFAKVLDQFKTIVDPWFDQVKEQFSKFGDVVAEGIENADFEKILLAFQTTFLGGIFLTLKKALGGGGKSFDITGGLFGSIKETLGAVTGQLTAMQREVQAKTILEIAAAVVVLAAGIYVISTIDPKQLTKAMTAIAVGLGELGAALKIMSAGGISGAVQMVGVASGMLVLSVAVLALAGAVKIFSTMNWDELERGLAGLGGTLVAIAAGMKLMPAARIIPISAGLVVLGVALNLIAVAVKIFASMKWEELAKGLLGLGLALAALGVGLAFIGPEVLLIGPGLIAAAIGMTLLAGAISSFGSMSLGELAKGILGAALAVAALGIAMLAIPPTIGIQAAGLILLGIGLTALGGAIAIFGSMSIGKLAKGIIAMGAALVVLGVGLTLMAGTLPGSVALLAAAAGLAVLAPTLAFMGVLPWSIILKGLAAMALSMAVIAVVGLVAAPALLALGGALAILGVGLVLIGTAIYIAAKGLALLGENGAKGIGVLVTAITAFVALLPSLVINFVKGLVSIVEELAKVTPKVVKALSDILDTVITFIIEQAPRLAVAAGILVLSFLQVLTDNVPKIVTAGAKLLTDFLLGIANNIGKITEQAVSIVVNFLDSLKKDAPKITASGAGTLTAFLQGITNQFPALISTAAKMITKFLETVTIKLPGIIASGARLMIKFLDGVASKIGSVIAAGVRLVVKFIEGIGNAAPRIVTAATTAAGKFIRAIAKAAVGLVDTGFHAIINFLNGVARAIRENDDAMLDAGANIADAIGDGLIKGLHRMGPAIKDAVTSMITALPKKALAILGIHSPSKVFQEIGQNVMAGMALGLEDGVPHVTRSMTAAANNVIDSAKDTIGRIPALLDGMVDMEPVIAPVLDLSAVQKEAEKLTNLTNVTPITAAASFGQATAISSEQSAAVTEATQVAVAGPTFSFEQNNYSPEALSDVEIYRQTNNQLSKLRGALGLAT